MVQITLITNPLTPVNSGFHAVIIARGYIGLSSTCRSQIIKSKAMFQIHWYDYSTSQKHVKKFSSSEKALNFVQSNAFELYYISYNDEPLLYFNNDFITLKLAIEKVKAMQQLINFFNPTGN